MIRQRRQWTFEEEHQQALAIGSEVTRWYRQEWEPNVLSVTPENVIAALYEAGIDFVLMGVHGINGYRDEPRASQDVDVLVAIRKLRRAVNVLDEAFPYLEIRDTPAVVRFVNPASQKGVIDVIKPASEAMRSMFRNSVRIGRTHRIPALEVALITKFLAFRSPTRRPEKKLLHAADFASIYLHNRARINVDKLLKLAARFEPRGARMIQAVMCDLDAGRTIQLN